MVHVEWRKSIIVMCKGHSGSLPYYGEKYKVDGGSALYQYALYIVELHNSKVHDEYFMIEVQNTKVH